MAKLREEDEAAIAKAQKPFEAHGVSFNSVKGSQCIGDCPFTGKENKFYVNWEREGGLWDSKTAGLSGNLSGFLEETSQHNQGELQRRKKLMARAALDRGLPPSALAGIELGWNPNTQRFTIPVRSGKGTVVDLRRWKRGGKIIGTPGCSTGLLGAEQLAASNDEDPGAGAGGRDAPVYVCEGEWDVAALRHLLREVSAPGVVVGLPGAGVFKREWVWLFEGRTVHLLYDQDGAGERGERTALERLTGSAAHLKFVRWPAEAPDGFDTRDWVRYGVVELQSADKCWAALAHLWRDEPRIALEESKAVAAAAGEGRAKAPKVGAQELEKVFRKWLKLPAGKAGFEPIAVAFATIIAGHEQGDPLWLFLVAPPGGMKSEILISTKDAKVVESCSALTPHSLVSGASWAGGDDPSMLPKLDRKVLVVKDFTTILSMHPTARDEVMGQLRDAYDGHHEKRFGNGIIRKYDVKFGFLAGVTPAIDNYYSISSELGERFLRYRMKRTAGKAGIAEEREKVLRAISNSGREDGMREELALASRGFLDHVEADGREVDEIGHVVDVNWLASVAMFVARARGVVHRDKYNPEMIQSKAGYEQGTRLSKQLTKLSRAYHRFWGGDVSEEDIRRVVLKVGMDSVPDKVEEVLKILVGVHAEGGDEPLSSVEVYQRSDQTLSEATFRRVLADLGLLGMVTVEKVGRKNAWRLSEETLILIDGLGWEGG